MGKKRKRTGGAAVTTTKSSFSTPQIDYEAKYADHPRLYVAYGSNLNVLQMQERCEMATPVTHGYLKEHKLAFSNVATVEHSPGDRCPIAVWELSAHDIGMLDRYEGFPTLYSKRAVTMEILGVKQVMFTYILNQPYELEPPWKTYFDTLEEGYVSWGLDLAYLDKALEEAHEAWDEDASGVTYHGKSDYNYGYYDLWNDSHVDTWEPCDLCGEWDKISNMTTFISNGLTRYICTKCDNFDELPTRKNWWETAEDVAASGSEDKEDKQFNPKELDYSGSYWNQSIGRVDYPLAY